MKTLSLLTAALLLTSVLSAQLTFEFTTENTTPEVEAAMEFAAETWGPYLNSEVPVKIYVAWLPLTGSTLGMTLPNIRANFEGAPEPDTWYPTTLANAITGVEQNPDEADMLLLMNSNFNYYLGTDGNPGPGQQDFVSVFMHEMVHGLGGLSLGNVDADDLGSFGSQTAEDLPIPFLPFPFPDLDSLPAIWDHFLVDLGGTSLLDTLTYPQPSVELGDAFTSQHVYFNGPLAVAANDGVNVRMYAPLTYASGSSLHHFNESTFPASNENALFTPQAGAGEVHHQPGPILMGALEDIGWSTNEVIVSTAELSSDNMLAYPNPAQNRLTVTGAQNASYPLLDASGRQVMTLNSGSNDVSALTAGMYLLMSPSGAQRVSISR